MKLHHNAALLAATLLATSHAALAQSQAPAAGKVVGPGVTWTTDVRNEGPLFFSIMRVEIDNPLVTLETEAGKDTLHAGEKVLDSILREEDPGKTEIIGGVNGDFWSSTPKPYSAVGLMVADGMIYNMPAQGRSAFVLTEDEKAYIGPVSLNVTLQSGDKILKIDRINSGTKSKDEIVLFTPPYGDTVAAESGKRYLLKASATEFLPNQPVEVTITETDSGLITPLSADTYVVHIPPDRLPDLPPFTSEEAAVLSAEMPQVKGVVRSVCGGGPAIVKDGKALVADEGMGESFSETKHPRTAVGISKDGNTIYLVTVDGRQPRISVGASLSELGAYMADLGCWEALNLDGGGSTSMIVNDKIVNHPSDFKGLRPVVNSLLVVAEAGSGQPHTLTFDPAGEPLLVPAGATVEVEISALDENSIPVILKPDAKITSSKSNLVQPLKLTVNRARITARTTPGDDTIQFSVGQATGSLPISVVQLDELIVEPAVLVLSAGDSLPVHVSATAGGEKVKLTPGMIQITSADASTVSVGKDGAKALKKGATHLQVTVGAKQAKVPVYVDMARGQTIEDFEEVADLSPLEGENFDQAATTVELEKAEVRQGTASARVNYAMSKGGKTRINIPLTAEITEAPASLGIWVFGDGQEAWLRANLVDQKGNLYIADFTDGADGITWKNQWRHVTVPFQSLINMDFTKSARPVLPLKVQNLTLAQDQEALKRSGTILLDGFEALYPPQN